MDAPRFRIAAIDLFERDVTLRLPFRFGAATLCACPQAFVRAHIELADGRAAVGASAELMVPKWFDKNPALSPAQNVDDLRASLRAAAEAYRSDPAARTAFGHFAAHHDALREHGRRARHEALVDHYGPALVDRALLDALCRALGVPFATLMQHNGAGIEADPLAPDLAGFDLDTFLRTLAPAPSIAARHTVGLLDAVRDADAPADAPRDGLPVSLEGAIRRHRLTHFKLKLCGDVARDLARLGAIAAQTDEVAERITLDGNEQYPDAAAFAAFLDALASTPALDRLVARTAFVEQPIRRDRSFDTDLSALAPRVPLLIDEADGSLDAFVQARRLGYRGVSSKSCKGLYKAVLNTARAAQWNATAAPADRCFVSGEDLTMQAGLAVQQDLALVALLGLPDVERNGHHYVDGMAALPAAEQSAFLAAHPDLYRREAGADGPVVRLVIERGRIALASLLAAPSFASSAWPDWATMRP